MISAQLSDQIFQPLIPAACASFRRLSTTKSKLLPCPRPKPLKLKHLAQNSKWAVRLSLVDQSPPKSTFGVERLVGFLYEDMVHLFYDQGIDRTAYDERARFRDPINKHDTITGYLLNIAFLKIVFTLKFQSHWVKETGSYEITTRWTMVMKFIPLPWRPELIFTGTSVMGINPETGKFCSHVDLWDSIKKNDYFSLEGFLDVFKQVVQSQYSLAKTLNLEHLYSFLPFLYVKPLQLRIYKTPDLETPKYDSKKNCKL